MCHRPTSDGLVRPLGEFTLTRYLGGSMSGTTHQCLCGATLRFRQDLTRERTGATPTWTCADCGTRVPGVVAEKLSHQHPS